MDVPILGTRGTGQAREQRHAEEWEFDGRGHILVLSMATWRLQQTITHFEPEHV
jgi:hypothetical protein